MRNNRKPLFQYVYRIQSVFDPDSQHTLPIHMLQEWALGRSDLVDSHIKPIDEWRTKDRRPYEMDAQQIP